MKKTTDTSKPVERPTADAEAVRKRVRLALRDYCLSLLERQKGQVAK